MQLTKYKSTRNIVKVVTKQNKMELPPAGVKGPQDLHARRTNKQTY